LSSADSFFSSSLISFLAAAFASAYFLASSSAYFFEAFSYCFLTRSAFRSSVILYLVSSSLAFAASSLS